LQTHGRKYTFTIGVLYLRIMRLGYSLRLFTHPTKIVKSTVWCYLRFEYWKEANLWRNAINGASFV